ncbi:enoyl-CoA hydratase/isomerase family protein [Mycolicibacterium vanbaalenii]|jgi:3-hydroxyacyl-CoA dehydrogenase/enoyl-CoA hydratase/3-hydroxybutyryl-CoA epimerase|uniref:3-hydroxyacyl-CoA dehydrogenase NAD-binding domain-containing protein n=1 Tax=Mycolicibacterium vanbaalenii TaxID=110539 RepID=UPI001F2DE5E6|nr:3-hydroxyacyl-CoA dehydrogenase NAD-binding domain-containing protein [Mycolicibacterium vanbaalenii]UJL29337.1 enoyl-CoA hydratase/isomerase family protein [Mycolicibacterium vanbaalenii]WND57635.1 3-hydroxyacyl-CoA dehydrogenase NAD-binding domain-containing protein [Mycolicibacterium vanbaalenii]
MTDNTIDWSEDRGVVTLTIADPGQRVNTMNAAFAASFDVALARLAAMGDALTGVVITSGKKTFFAGGDLRDLLEVDADNAAQFTAFLESIKRQLRTLETLGVPVVAAINGSALGGGLELALACHHRIALDDPHIRIGLPEVTLGLLPGAGGVVRTVRLLGLDTALDKVLLPGTAYRPADALQLGLIDDIATDTAALRAAARAWILAHRDARQSWDDGDAVPGGRADDPGVATTLPTRAATLRARHHGAPMPAAAAILSAAVESTVVDVETALAVETRYFVQLATGQIAKNIIQGTFFDRQTVRSGASRPRGFMPPHRADSVAVLGAGMMGAGIALSAALAGITVKLKDVDCPRAERGKAYAARVLAKRVAAGKHSQAEADAILGRICATDDVADLAGCDLVIEAVFEDPELKGQVFKEVLDAVAPDALLASNTSTLPITGLARSVDRPADFIGLHFFSPVERMDLVEIVVGEQTSEATLARAFDIVLQLGKTPIVVGDGRGFFTSRVILARLLEAAAMLGEGIAPASIEQASLQAGYPVGTLALLDELTLTLPHNIYGQFRDEARATGAQFVEHPGDAVLATMIEDANRPGRAAGAGFDDYADGRRVRLWAGLNERFGPGRPGHDLSELIDRLLIAEALETARCLESGLLRSTADANVGSLLGIGFPVWTGGAAQFIAGYPGGLAAFAARSRQLAEEFGPRFTPPASLVSWPTEPVGVN